VSVRKADLGSNTTITPNKSTEAQTASSGTAIEDQQLTGEIKKRGRKSKKRLFRETIRKYEELEFEIGPQPVKVALKKKKIENDNFEMLFARYRIKSKIE